jgi:hypothetical protein
MELEENGHKCESCNSDLVESRKFIASTYVYWHKPWGSSLKMSVPVIPYACMNCGRVFLFLGDKNKIVREYHEISQNGEKPAQAG